MSKNKVRSFQLNQEDVDSLILIELTAHLKFAEEDVKRLETLNRLKGLEPYQEEDLRDFRSIKKALKKVVKYYGG